MKNKERNAVNLEEAVRRELRELKYYYSRKANMDELFKETGATEILSIVQKYNNYIRAASARLYDLYGCLYLQNKTQTATAIELGYTQEYVRKANKELMTYFCGCIERERR